MAMNKYIYGRWTVFCSFCGQSGHNIRSCSDIIPAAADHDCKKWDAVHVAIAQGEIKRRQQVTERTPASRKKPRCGFCGGRKHNRKNCHKLKKIRKLLYSGNARWRRRFVERTNTLGIGDGALIEVRGIVDELAGLGKTYPTKSKHLGVIEPFDCDSLNVFCNFLGHWDYRSQTEVRAKVATDRGFISVKLGRYIGEDLFYKNTFFSQYASIRVISRSQWASPHDWIAEKNLPPIEWLLKTHNLEELKDFQIINFIEKWT